MAVKGGDDVEAKSQASGPVPTLVRAKAAVWSRVS
jgi:hypothetical protein